jgi:subtilisin family serine protease
VYQGGSWRLSVAEATDRGITVDSYENPDDKVPSSQGSGGGGGNGGGNGDGGSRPRIASTPEEEPAGRHYHYVADEILVVEDDVRLVEDQLQLRGMHRVDVFRPRVGRETGTGVVRFRLPISTDEVPTVVGDVLSTVTALRTPVPDPAAHATGESDRTEGPPPTYVPRVFPNIVVELGWHGRPHGAFNRRRAETLDSPPRRRFLPMPGHGMRIGVVDTGMWDGRLSWFGDRVDLRPIDVEPLGDAAHELLTDINGHGTFIAGIIHGIAPGAKVKVRRFGDTGVIADRDLAEQILRLVEEGVDIINVSAGGPTHDNSGMVCTEQTIDLLRRTRPDLVIVASAGNAGVNNPEFPAAFKGVVGVGAIDSHDVKAFFSNFGSWVDVCAPGVDVHSTFVDWASPVSRPDQSFDGYAQWSGTSFSAPAVAAEIAVCRSPGGWRQFLWFLRPRNARRAADAVVNDPEASRLPGLGTVVKPRWHTRRHR